MKRSVFLKSLCAASAAGLSACSTTSTPSAGTGTSWPSVAYKSVRAFVYDCEAEHQNMTFLNKGGRIHDGVINAPGALLSPAQVARVISIASTPATRDKYKPCYVPHHAIVFFDDAERPVACLEICFTCRRHIASPSGTPDIIDYPALWALMHELGVPAERGEGYYRRLYREKKKAS